MPSNVRWSIKRILCSVCFAIIIVNMMVGYYILQCGYVSGDIARLGMLVYYSLESNIGLTFSFGVPTFTKNQKWKIYHRHMNTYWNNHTGCRPIEESFMLFAMRTPKAASTTLEELISKLADRNKYVVNHETVLTLDHPKFTPEVYVRRARDLAEHFAAMNRRVVSCAHIRFIDFEGFHLPQPHYVGTVRDPVLRMQSSYNYDFFADRPLHVEHIDDKTRSKVRQVDTPTFVECVRAHMQGNAPESYACLRPTYINTQLRYYCGMNHVGCRNSYKMGDAAMEFIYKTAVSNMNKHFRVVMVVERMRESVALLEKTLPVYFRGAMEIYNSSSDGMRSNVNTKLPSPSVAASPASSSSALHGDPTSPRKYIATNSTAPNIPSSISGSTSAPVVPLVRGIPADVRNYLEQGLLKYEIRLYEAALRHMDHNMKQCGMANEAAE